jgi:hypothetical protein
MCESTTHARQHHPHHVHHTFRSMWCPRKCAEQRQCGAAVRMPHMDRHHMHSSHAGHLVTTTHTHSSAQCSHLHLLCDMLLLQFTLAARFTNLPTGAGAGAAAGAGAGAPTGHEHNRGDCQRPLLQTKCIPPSLPPSLQGTVSHHYACMHSMNMSPLRSLSAPRPPCTTMLPSRVRVEANQPRGPGPDPGTARLCHLLLLLLLLGARHSRMSVKLPAPGGYSSSSSSSSRGSSDHQRGGHWNFTMSALANRVLAQQECPCPLPLHDVPPLSRA